jgi:tetratricopeptide (TPR) repeat protein
MRWVVVLLITVGSSVMVGAQEYKGRAKVKGKVKNAQGENIKDPMVKAVFLETGTGPETKKGKGNGNFEIKNLKPGMWKLTIVAPTSPPVGYGGVFVEVEVTQRDMQDLQVTLPTLQEQLAAGQDQLKAKHYTDARNSLLGLLAALPMQWNVNQLIATAYQEEGNHEKALTHIDAYLAGVAAEQASGAALPNPRNETNVRIQALDSAAQLGDYERMNAYLNAIGPQMFGRPVVTTVIGVAVNTLIPAENFDEAIALLSVAIEKSPDSAAPYFRRGMAYVKIEEDESAVVDLEKFVDMSVIENAEVLQAKEVLEGLALDGGAQQ